MSRVDILALGAHPDDVELGCGATLAKLARAGRRIGILHLTRGEAGTRGTAEQRQREAERAAEILGAVELSFLDCGDGCLRHGPSEEEALIAELRRLRPELVFAPTPADRHPDHGRSHRLTVDACFYAGLARRGSGRPHRPAALFTYMQHDHFVPAFVVDVTEVWPVKMAALDAYGSQIHPGAGSGGVGEGPPIEDDRSETATKVDRSETATKVDRSETATKVDRSEAATKVASREFRLAVEGRARHYGNLIGAELGEPFGALGPLAVADPWELLPRGLR